MKKRARRRRDLIKRKHRWFHITSTWWGLTPNEKAGVPDPLDKDYPDYYPDRKSWGWYASIKRHWSPEHPAAHAFACAVGRAQTAAPCSCPSCGNPRVWFGTVTRQEKRSWDNLRYQLEELAEMGLLLPRPSRYNRQQGTDNWSY